MTLPVDAPAVRGYLGITNATRNYSDGRIGSNLRASADFLQRATRRQFEPQTAATKTFTTNGEATISIPDLRTATSVTLQGSALTANASYWLIGRPGESTYTTVQFRAFGGDYRSNPDWFDRNLDWYASRGYVTTSLPNDLVIVGDWGHLPYPESFSDTLLIHAAWKSKRPDSLLANVQVTPEGAILNFGNLPGEVQDFINAWRISHQAALV